MFFSVQHTQVGAAYLFIIFLPLLIAALCFEFLWIYTVSLMICVWALVATLSGQGPFTGQLLNENLVHLQLFLTGLGITAIGIASLKIEGLSRRVSVALVFGWILSGLTFYSFYNSTFEVDRSRFTLKSEQAEEAIQQKLKNYINLLESGVGFFNASDFVSQSEWRTFTEKLFTNEDYLGLESLSVAFPTPILNVDYFNKSNSLQEKKSDFNFFSVPERVDALRVDNPDSHFIITYTEPYATKKNLIGLDLSSEKNRYEAAIKARDTGLPSASNPVHLSLKSLR